jgi:nicotinate-nucleotide pyrophosphorylase (carboxylating)
MEERARIYPLPSRTAPKDDVVQPLALAFTSPPSALLIEPIVRAALVEDLGRAGDITTDAIIPAGVAARAVIAAREAGVVSGLIAADLAFKLMDPEVRLTPRAPDGSEVAAGSIIAEIEGPARAILSGERVALNFLAHLSGVATATQRLVKTIAGTKARIICTRKTIPGMRVLQKYAVRCGGGLNHRFGLDDAVLIKDNHIAAAGGVAASIRALRGRLGPMVKIEVEVDTLAQLEEALSAGAGAILLDNMPPEKMARAVAITGGRATLEASGGVTFERVRAIAESGVDYISSGALTHSARAMDVGLDFI